MDLKECKNKQYVKEVSKDEPLIDSLKKSSSKKLESQKRLTLDETTATTKISIAYDSLRELLEALALTKGYKIYNHECYQAFLEEICKERELSIEFNKFRKLRNQINYYGKDLHPEEAKIVIEEITHAREKILKKYF